MEETTQSRPLTVLALIGALVLQVLGADALQGSSFADYMVPGIQVLYGVGYVEHVVVEHGVLDMELGLIEPIEPRALQQRIREMLDVDAIERP